MKVLKLILKGIRAETLNLENDLFFLIYREQEVIFKKNGSHIKIFVKYITEHTWYLKSVICTLRNMSIVFTLNICSPHIFCHLKNNQQNYVSKLFK